MKKVLVIEDDADTIEMVEYLLQDAGYAVIKINREVFLSEIAAINPDLVVLDYLLPHALGNNLCSSLKSDPKTKHIPVILYSASNLGKKVADECKADEFIPKPFDVDLFLDKVDELTQRKK